MTARGAAGPAPSPDGARARRRAGRRAALAAGSVLVLAACGSGATPGAAPRSPGTSAAGGARPVTLAFAGDVHFEGVSRAALSGGLAAVTPLLSAADLTVVNLETTISRRGTPVPGKQYTFRAPPAALVALERAGVDVVTLANNHGLDYGRVALADTLAAAEDAGLALVGAGVDEAAAFAPHVAEVRGTRVAVIGATQVLDDDVAAAWTAREDEPGLASAKDAERLVEAVRAAKQDADVVAVDLHWGVEQQDCPSRVQRSLAARLAAAGADVVVGSHAHVLLGGGWLGETYVDYGLGNFVFYARTAATQATGVLTLTLDAGRVRDARWAPARIGGGLPVPLTGSAATAAGAAKDRLRSCTGLAAAP